MIYDIKFDFGRKLYEIYFEDLKKNPLEQQYFISNPSEVNSWIALALRIDIENDFFTAIEVSKELYG